jgi:hypothetical protein
MHVYVSFLVLSHILSLIYVFSLFSSLFLVRSDPQSRAHSPAQTPTCGFSRTFSIHTHAHTHAYADYRFPALALALALTLALALALALALSCTHTQTRTILSLALTPSLRFVPCLTLARARVPSISCALINTHAQNLTFAHTQKKGGACFLSVNRFLPLFLSLFPGATQTPLNPPPPPLFLVFSGPEITYPRVNVQRFGTHVFSLLLTNT